MIQLPAAILKTSAGCVMAVLLLAMVLADSAAFAQAASRRVAFVVGNSAYQNVPALPNTRNDADAVAKSLRNSGFEVFAANDLDYAQFDVEMRKFVRSLANADVSLFYYSGHGIQIGGDNRIIPIDAKFKSSSDMEVETITVRTILSYMQASSRNQVIILDSCRNNPFPARSYYIGNNLEKVPESGGLAALDAGSGSLIAYSTQPGNVAVDGFGEYSPFTEAFVKNAFEPGIDIESAMKKVTKAVWETTGQRQRPWTSQTLIEPLYLNSAPATAVAEAPEPAPAAPAEQQVAALPETNLSGILRDSLSAVQFVPIGVGAVAMMNPLPTLRGGTIDVELSQPPSKGVYLLNGKVLRGGKKLPISNWNEVTYQPSIGTEGTEIATEWTVHETGATAAMPVAGQIRPFVVDCDLEAGEPLDLQGVADGKLPNEIDVAKAIPACTDAMQRYPNVARFIYQLGRAHLAAKQVDEAVALFKRAYDQGHVRSAYQLGYMAQRGVGGKQNLTEANDYFKYSALNGDPYGMLAYGRNLVMGRGTAADVGSGIQFLSRAVEMGHTYAMNELGSMYLDGRGVEKNPERGARFYQAALDRGDIYAMNNLGLAYLDGAGVERDFETAMALFKKASDGGHPSAPNNVGRMYFGGKGVKEDVAKAVEWYRKGAERGDTWAASNLAWVYQNGPKKLRNEKSAALLYGQAVSLDVYGSNAEAAVALKALPDKAKAAAMKQLISELGSVDVELPSDLDQALVELSRLAWQKRNPRFDLF